MTIYPAIDLLDGQVVRLRQGRADDKTVYFDDPLVPARRWQEHGATWLHVVDLNGAFAGAPANREAIATLALRGPRVQVGGGVRTVEHARELIGLGVARVVLGTRAATEPTFVAEVVEACGPSAVAVGIDARDGRVALRGWTEDSALLAVDLAQTVVALGVQTIIYTDISRDGMLSGPNLQAMEALLAAVPARIIASGGVGSLADVEDLARLSAREPRLEGVIIGKALYERTLDLADALRVSA